ncbi:XRE family transcriptional regulator [Sphingopyxis yananensis]|uniref:XRE family transcriptional regulator n=1 Tax=Sphingopyxis yananensis TaxID=2886687 RepID=UPI001D0FF924|nr:S24 family peptidase [Sphingopyxis yananensis]MCC2602552.1 helix-turn-helix domain-containing protein [Sphingopyxis yananensis]
MVDKARFRARMDELGVSQASLARSLDVSQSTIAKLALGESSGSKHLHRIAKALKTTPEYLTGVVDDPDAGYTPPLPASEVADELGLVAIKEIDLTFGMGMGFVDTSVEETVRYFPSIWLRDVTRTPPQHLAFARARGDSMKPTLADGDIVIIDTLQKSIREQDAVWAVAVGQILMVKRIWANADGSSKIKSDNPNVDAEFAADGEMHVIGQVVGKIGKL